MNKKYYITLVAVMFTGLLAMFYSFSPKQNAFAVDTSAVAPHVITKQDYNGVELQPELKKIQGEILTLLLEKYPDSKDYYSNLSLRGIGNDFAVITINRPTDAGALDELVNLKTGESSGLGATDSSFDVDSGFVYIDSNVIRYYSLGSSNAVVLAGSALIKSNETYNSGGDMKITPVETHTDSSISITVFDSSTISQGADTVDYKFKALRTEEFTFAK